jgi:hypothetical protein
MRSAPVWGRSAATVTLYRLTFPSNVVAYACRPPSRKDRHDIQHRRLIRRSAIGRRRETIRAACRRLVHGRQMSGGKGGKGGNLESLGNRAFPTMPQSGGNWQKLVSAPSCRRLAYRLRKLRKPPRRVPPGTQWAGRTRSSIGGRYADTRSSRSARRATWLGSMWT